MQSVVLKYALEVIQIMFKSSPSYLAKGIRNSREPLETLFGSCSVNAFASDESVYVSACLLWK